MAAQLIMAFVSTLLVQTIFGQNTNAGIIDVTNVGIAGRGVGLSNNGNGLSGFGSGLSDNTNAGVIDITNKGVTGNGISISNNGRGYSYGGNDGSGYGSINARAIDVTNIGVTGNGIGLASGDRYGNLGLANGIGYGNLGLTSSGIGANYGSVNNYGYAAPSFSNSVAFGNGYGANSNSGGFSVSSASPLAPTGLDVVSENIINGGVNVNGVLPFLSTIALGGQVASGGSASVQYNCGNGNIGIISENDGAGNAGYGAGLGYGAGIGAGNGFGGLLGGATVAGPAIANIYGSTCGRNY